MLRHVSAVLRSAKLDLSERTLQILNASPTTLFRPALVSLIAVASANLLFAQQLAFELPDPQDKQISIRPGDTQLTAVCFLGTQCPMARAYTGTLSRLQQEYADSGLRIVGVMSNRQDSLEEILRYVEETRVDFEVAIENTKFLQSEGKM